MFLTNRDLRTLWYATLCGYAHDLRHKASDEVETAVLERISGRVTDLADVRFAREDGAVPIINVVAIIVHIHTIDPLPVYVINSALTSLRASENEEPFNRHAAPGYKVTVHREIKARAMDDARRGIRSRIYANLFYAVGTRMSDIGTVVFRMPEDLSQNIMHKKGVYSDRIYRSVLTSLAGPRSPSLMSGAAFKKFRYGCAMNNLNGRHLGKMHKMVRKIDDHVHPIMIRLQAHIVEQHRPLNRHTLPSCISYSVLQTLKDIP